MKNLIITVPLNREDDERRISRMLLEMVQEINDRGYSVTQATIDDRVVLDVHGMYLQTAMETPDSGENRP